MINSNIIFLLFCCVLACYACENPTESIGQSNGVTNTEEDTTNEIDVRAAAIVGKAIEVHGGKAFENCRIQFDFRSKHYVAFRQGGDFQYERIYEESGSMIRDVLKNDGFERFIDGESVKLDAKTRKVYSNSVNSVIYFALIPYFLKNPAVNYEHIGMANLEDKSYHKIKVTFEKEGGGKDYQDEFVYWIEKEQYTVDYLAYNYQTDGGGARFRDAYNIRTINGIRFADYINYKPEPQSMEVASFDQLFGEGKMKELSRIDLENVEVEILGFPKEKTSKAVPVEQ